MKIIFISITGLFIALLLVFNGHSQSAFNRIYQDTLSDGAYRITQTLDGGYIYGGMVFYLNPHYDACGLYRTDCSGNVIWERYYNLSSTGTESIDGIIQLSDNSFIVAGGMRDSSNSSGAAYLMKLNKLGNTIWLKLYGGAGSEGFLEIKQTIDSGYIMVGYTTTNSNGSQDSYVVKTDSAGNIEWENKYGGSGGEVFYSINLTPDSGYILCGVSNSFGNGYDDIYIVKTDSLGNEQWHNTYGEIYDDYSGCAIPFQDGYIIVSAIDEVSDGSKYHSCIIKIDSSGNLLWQKEYHNYVTNMCSFHNVFNNNNNLIINGNTKLNSLPVAYQWEGWLVKADANGDTLWSKHYGTTLKDDYFYDLQLTADGGFINAGIHYETGINGDALLVKTDSMGCDQPICDQGCDSCAYIEPAIFTIADTLNLQVSDTLRFYDHSAYAQHWFWYFGDSDTDTLQNPLHIFDTTGVFNVMLVAYWNNCSDTVIKTVTVVNGTDVKPQVPNSKSQIQIAPNPVACGSEFTISAIIENGSTEIEISNVAGVTIGRYTLPQGSPVGGSIEVNSRELGRGIFFVKAQNNKGFSDVKKVVVY